MTQVRCMGRNFICDFHVQLYACLMRDCRQMQHGVCSNSRAPYRRSGRLRTHPSVMMSRGLDILANQSSIICMPACFASWIRAEYTAGIVPLPFKPMPSASVRQFMVLAVYIPEQEPQVGHTLSSYLLQLFRRHGACGTRSLLPQT